MRGFQNVLLMGKYIHTCVWTIHAFISWFYMKIKRTWICLFEGIYQNFTKKIESLEVWVTWRLWTQGRLLEIIQAMQSLLVDYGAKVSKLISVITWFDIDASMISIYINWEYFCLVEFHDCKFIFIICLKDWWIILLSWKNL